MVAPSSHSYLELLQGDLGTRLAPCFFHKHMPWGHCYLRVLCDPRDP